MSTEPHGGKRRTGVIFSEAVDDPAELARAQEKYDRYMREPDNQTVVLYVLDHVFDPKHAHHRDLVGVILLLLEELTPEQRQTLDEKLRATPAAAANGQA